MSILDANGAMACAECGRQARVVRDRLKAENEKLRDENRRLRELVRCLVNAEHPSDRATLIANAADMLAEL